MSKQSEQHNILAGRFVQEIIGPAIKSGMDYAELAVFLETAQVGIMEILHQHYGLSPQVASGLCEESMGQAIERFAALRRTN